MDDEQEEGFRWALLMSMNISNDQNDRERKALMEVMKQVEHRAEGRAETRSEFDDLGLGMPIQLQRPGQERMLGKWADFMTQPNPDNPDNPDNRVQQRVQQRNDPPHAGTNHKRGRN